MFSVRLWLIETPEFLLSSIFIVGKCDPNFRRNSKVGVDLPSAIKNLKRSEFSPLNMRQFSNLPSDGKTANVSRY